MVDDVDAAHMDRALFLAARGRGRTSPNPIVGAVVVSPDGVVVGQGAHERAGEPHAEVHALNAAGSRARGATLYCTLEPCVHVGRTGPCAGRIVDAGIARVVAAMEDPNPLVHGRGFAFLRDRGVAVDVGVGESAARDQNQPFVTRIRTGRPFVIAKAAVSADGYIAAAPGRPTPLTSPAANRHAHALRAEVDAIGVGVGTILADDPLLTARAAYRERPFLRVIFDRSLRTPPTARVLSTASAGPVMIVATGRTTGFAERRQRLERAGAVVATAPEGTVGAVLGLLGAQGVGSLLLEGGAALHGAALDEDVVDFVRLYVTPHVLDGGVRCFGGHPIRTALLASQTARSIGPDTLIEGYVHGPR